MTANFVHLHVHTEYSIVDSTVRIPELIDRCAEYRMPAVALTDQSNVFGLVKMYRKAIESGIKPIIGADLRITGGPDGPGSAPERLIVLCQDRDGYRNLDAHHYPQLSRGPAARAALVSS